MTTSASVHFFEQQFQRQSGEAGLHLNPFEEAALPWLQGRVLDYGCGLGNLALTAARRACTVTALDASHTAIAGLRQIAADEGLPLQAIEADLSDYSLDGTYDTVVCIGLLMFLDCEDALRQLAQLQDRLRPGGAAVVNVLIEGTSYMDMFDPQRYCLLKAQQLRECFTGWSIEYEALQDFPAPGEHLKSFITLIARKPSV